MSRSIRKILTKKVTRRQFLTYLGMMVIAVFGISSFLKSLKSILNPNLTKITKLPKTSKSKTSFGSGLYGV